MSKKVLFVTYHFPPSAASGTHRILGFAEHLPRFGWDVGVLAPPRIPWEPADEALLSRVPRTTRVHRVKYPSGYLYWPMRKAHGYMAWLPRAISAARTIAKSDRPDVVVTSGPPHCVHLVGLFLKKVFGIHWIADFRDPWVEGNPIPQNGSWRTPFARFGEKWVYRHSDGVVLNTPNVRDFMCAVYPRAAAKAHFVTNGYDPTHFDGINFAGSHRFVITHTGELYAGRDPRSFLDAVQTVISAAAVGPKKLLVEFAGNCTAPEFDISAEISRRGLNDFVRLVGQVSHRASLERMVNSDVLLLIDSPGRTLGVPAKLYEYIGARRPILALASEKSDVRWVLENSRVPFQIAGPDVVSQIAGAITTLMTQRHDAAATLGDSMFCRSSVSRKLSEIMLETLCHQGPKDDATNCRPMAKRDPEQELVDTARGAT